MQQKTPDFFLAALRALLHNSQDMIFIKDLDLRYCAATPAFAALAGCTPPEEILGKNDFDLFEPGLAARYVRDDREVLVSGFPIRDRLEPIPCAEGTERHALTCKYPIRDSDGTVIGLCGVARDITTQIRLTEELERRRVFDGLFENVLESDLTENRVLRNEGRLFDEGFILPRDCTFEQQVACMAEQLVHPDYADEFRERYNRKTLLSSFDDGLTAFSHITYQRIKGQDYRWIEYTTRLYRFSLSGTVRIAAFLRDLDNEVRDRELLRQRAASDPLTGLLNRKSTIDEIVRCINGHGAQQTHALLFIDLDHFKSVNDTLGHPVGDQILAKAAQKLRSSFRQGDIVGRIGGDEFLVLLKDVRSRDIVTALARKLLETLPLRPTENDMELCVTCSIGIAMYNGDGKRFAALYEEADQAMYRAKHAGKNRFEFY